MSNTYTYGRPRGKSGLNAKKKIDLNFSKGNLKYNF